MFSIGALALKATGKRTGAPVHRYSKPLGKCEAGFWRRVDKREVWKIVDAAEAYDLANKAPGARKGPLGSIAIKVLKALARFVDYRTGRLDPSLDTIMHHARCSRDSAVRALDALRRHGFVDWLRRFVPAETAPGEKGPQVKQASNAYRLSLPARAMALLTRHKRAPAPVPVDEEERQAEKARQEEDFTGLSGKTDAELLQMTHSIDQVAAASARTEIRLRSLRKKRESDYQTESAPNLIYYME